MFSVEWETTRKYFCFFFHKAHKISIEFRLKFETFWIFIVNCWPKLKDFLVHRNHVFLLRIVHHMFQTVSMNLQDLHCYLISLVNLINPYLCPEWDAYCKIKSFFNLTEFKTRRILIKLKLVQKIKIFNIENL